VKPLGRAVRRLIGVLTAASLAAATAAAWLDIHGDPNAVTLQWAASAAAVLPVLAWLRAVVRGSTPPPAAPPPPPRRALPAGPAPARQIAGTPR
jgi:hypothetical protein